MLLRRTLQFGLLVVIATIAVGLLDSFDVGLDLPVFDESEPTAERIQTVYAIDSMRYRGWGVWVDLGTLLIVAAVLVATPFLAGIKRAVHIVVAGAAIAVVGDLIDISQLVAMNLADFALDEGLAADFTAANTYRFALNWTAAYVWAGGVAIAGSGLLIHAWDSPHRRLGGASGMLAVALIAMAAVDIWGSGDLFELVSYLTAAVALWWFVTALRSLDSADED